MQRAIPGIIATVSLLLLSGCPHVDYPTCASPPLISPDGICSVHYYKTDFGSGGAVTQAWADCQVKSSKVGGNIVAFHTLKHGIALRWLGPTTLEIGVPNGVELVDKRPNGYFAGHHLTYQYRWLSPSEPDFNGCTPAKSSGT